MIEECAGKTYEERLQIVGLTTLECRRLRTDLIEVFKILKGFEGIEEKRFLRNIYPILGVILCNCIKTE
jgi:hypothetical protein